jgi:hypothetical protein
MNNGHHDLSKLHKPGDLTCQKQQQPKFRIQDNPSIIETYANKFIGAVFDGGAVSILKGRMKRRHRASPRFKPPIV